MDNTFDMKNFIVATEADKEHVLGKFLYFSLANLLVEKDALSKLCDDMGISIPAGSACPWPMPSGALLGTSGSVSLSQRTGRPISIWPIAGTISARMVSYPGNW